MPVKENGCELRGEAALIDSLAKAGGRGRQAALGVAAHWGPAARPVERAGRFLPVSNWIPATPT